MGPSPQVGSDQIGRFMEMSPVSSISFPIPLWDRWDQDHLNPAPPKNARPIPRYR